MMTIDFISAFVIGILGSGHCLGMCGGITTMLTAALPNSRLAGRLPLVLCYNLGRISSYALIGAIVGFTGSIASKNIGMPLAGLRLIAAFFLILLGLYLGQWLMWLTHVEKFGRKLWRYLSPLSKKFIPVNTAKKALGLGLVWGWLPCGLVYSMLTWSLASGSALNGAAIMASFGLGTLPMLMVMSLGLMSVQSLIIGSLFRKIMAVLLITYGIYSLIIAYSLAF